MIRYTLKCASDHGFDSWFQSADSYDTLVAAGHVSCPVCGVTQVEKALMAPRVSHGDADPAPPNPGAPDLSAPGSEMERAMAELRRRVEENSDYVGARFVTEARSMHEGTSPERAIYGEARPDEVVKLLEDGVPVAPLPFMPSRKTN
jgi:hypothetical protein